MSIINLNHELVSQKMKSIFETKGMNTASIEHCINSITQTSLRGVDSHGINLFPHYCRALDADRINSAPNFQLVKDSPSGAVIDADHAFGHHAGAYAMDMAIEKAKKTGMSAIGVINSTHFGAAAYFALRAAKADCIGWSFTNADSLVKAHSAVKPFFGTNPICFSAPMKGEEPFCLDMATSTISWNKLKNHLKVGEQLDESWAFDALGQPIVDPQEAASLRPIGDYKGFGLGMMIDILCGTLTGGLISNEILPMFTSPIEARRKVSHFFMVMDISKFNDIESFKTNLSKMATDIRSMNTNDSNSDMMIAGDPEKKQFAIRTIKGIPMNENIWKEFLAIDSSFKNCII